MANLMAYGFWHPRIYEAQAAARPLLFLAPSLVATAAAHASIAPLRGLLRRALTAAALANRTLILPEVPCDAPWMRRPPAEPTQDAPRAVADRRVLVVGDYRHFRCYVGAHSLEFCWPWAHAAFAFEPLAAQRAPAARDAAAWQALLPGGALAGADATATHLPAALDTLHAPQGAAADAAIDRDAPALKAVQAECPDYFSNLPTEEAPPPPPVRR
jgi:hypothetical protein